MSSGPIFDPVWTQSLLRIIDLGLVLTLCYVVLLIVGERRTLWMVRGVILLMIATGLSKQLRLEFLSFVLEKLVIGSALAMAFIYQSEFRRFLEQLGRGQFLELFRRSGRILPNPNNVIDQLVDAVKDLSQSRTGALIVLEIGAPLDERDFPVQGVKLNADVSKELLQSIFQTTTILHDGAVFIRSDRLVSAGVILPLSERTASRQLGTRHRAAMGITERISNCVCIVVSEETGSISLAERGMLNRPLTSSKLKELLEAKLSATGDEQAVPPGLRSLVRQIATRARTLLNRMIRLPSSTSQKKK